MLSTTFKNMKSALMEIAQLPEPARTKHLDLFMSQGYLFLDLTDNQVSQIKALFATCYPDKFVQYPEPDSHGFTAEFGYLRFK